MSTEEKINKTNLTARVIKVDSAMSSFMGYMPNPDEVLQNTGQAVGVYREMKTDPRIKSLLSVAKAGILGYAPLLEKDEAEDKVYSICEKAIDKVPVYEVVKRLLSAIDYGYSAVEVVWENQGGWWLPADVVLRKPERFSFSADGRLKHTQEGKLIDLYSQEYKWLVFRYDKDAENPYGTSALKACYWPWKFKKAGIEFWLMAAEKFAVPSILALFDTSEPEDKIRERALELSELLSSVQSGSGAALANIKDTKVLTANDAISEFKTLMDWCDTQIAYGIVGQSLSVQEAEHGTRAQAEVHAGTLASLGQNTCRELESPVQRLINWVVELNFGPHAIPPRFRFDLEAYATWQEVRDAIDRGIPVSTSALYSRYGLPEPSDEKDQFLKDGGSVVQGESISQGGISQGESIIQPGSDNIQKTALNGAQVSSLIDLATQVSNGELPVETALSIAQAAFPLIGKDKLIEIFERLTDKKLDLSDPGKKKQLRKTLTLS